jgi:ABC-type dipeptide/oligopeptide/nickel transport system permease component
MIRFVVRRCALAIPTLFLLLTGVFVLVRLVPGDPAAVILGDQASQAALAALRAKLGIDQPIAIQYVAFLRDTLTLHLGRSLSTGNPVILEVMRVLPWTLELTVAAMAVALAFGLPLGVLAAARRNTWLDYLGRLVSLLGLSFPAFVSGILLLLVFGIQLGWFPVLGSSAGTAGVAENLWQLVLPACNLGLIMMAYVMRVTRSSMLSALGQDYIRTARAKGVRPMRLILRHGLRNSLIPVVTVVGLYTGTLIGNSVLTEIIFNRPGLGKLILAALDQRDYTLLQGLMVIFGICVVVINALTDIAYGFIDPRVRYD